jgi:hypothetical protein
VAKRFDLWLMMGVFALSLALRVAFTLGFDGLYGQDPYAYYNFAQELRIAVSEHRAPTPFFWPLGYPALLAVGFTVFGASPLVAQVISLVLGALLAPLVYVLARQIGVGRSGTLAAALIMAACGQAIQSSMVVMADIPALVWATISAILLLDYLHNERQSRLIFAAGALALACISRWLYLVLLPIWGAVLLLTWRRVRWRASVAAGAAAALILLPQVAFSVGSPYPVLNHAWVQGWSPANALAYSFSNIDGQFVYPHINAIYYAQPYYDFYYLAPIFTPFMLIGLWALRRKAAPFVLLLGWGLLPYLFLIGIPYQNIRFPLIVVPAAAVLAGIGLETVLLRRRAIFAVVVIAGLVLTLYAARDTIGDFVANQNRDKTAVQWAIRRIPADARVYTFELTLPLQAYAPFEVRELYYETLDTIALALKDGKDSYLFVNIWVIQEKWAGRELDEIYDWLRDLVGLRFMGRSSNYILFRVGR